MRRSKQEICVDILNVLALNGPLRPTPLANKVKVSNCILNQCLSYLCQQNLVEKRNVKNKVVYAATKKGWDIIKSVELDQPQIQILKTINKAF